MKIKIQTDKSLTPNAYIALILILFISTISFFSPIYRSIGTLSYLFALILLLLSANSKTLTRVFPILALTTTVEIILILSGRFSERGFNAPISHATKFNALLLAAIIADYMKRASTITKKKIIRFALFLLTISILISLYYVLRVDKYAIRYNNSWGYSYVLRFEQTYCVCILAIALVFVFLSIRKSSVFNLPSSYKLLLIPLFVICVALSLFATALLILVLGIVLSLEVRIYERSKIRFYTTAFFTIIAILGVLIFSDEVAMLIYKATEKMNWVIQLRIRGVVDALLKTQLSTGYSMERRSELASYSLTTFKNHPLFGAGYSGFGYGIIGMHQEWYDLLGTFGIIGTIVFFMVFGFFCRTLYKQCNNQLDRSCFLICLCMFFVLGIVNPCLSFPVLFSVLCVAPNISCICQEGVVL